MARKRKAPEQDDATLAGMALDAEAAEATTARKRKAKAAEHVDPWAAVAAECPLRLSADYHRDHPERHHIQARGACSTAQGATVLASEVAPVLCVPSADPMPAPLMTPSKEPWGNFPHAATYRVTDAYSRAKG